jgi:phosphoribosyl 1,2-cyclic phosphodiesterase
MRAVFLGVRGSTPAPGAAFVRVGGHTSCLAIGADDGPATLVLDAGTGLRQLTARLDGSPFRGTILLTHLHWDHVMGLPFFAAGDRDGAVVTLGMPAQGDPRAVLARAMSPPHFPIGPDGLLGDWTFLGLEPGEHAFEGFTVLAAEIPHKGGRTYGYRVTSATGSLAYLPDHGPHDWGPGPDDHGVRHPAALALAADVDVLVHGGQYTDADRVRAIEYGHATVAYAIALATEAGARELVLSHHEPSRTDDAVDGIIADADAVANLPVRAACEGLELRV